MRKVEPGNIVDWATKAAEHINPKDSVSRIAAVIATHAEPLMKLLREARRSHDVRCLACGDEDEAPEAAGVCTCGADTWNQKIDAALQGH